jgi:signal transduction histidine kinase
VSFTESVLLVAAVAAVATLLILLSLLISHAPLTWWPFALASFLVICFLAVQTASQRSFIRRYVAEAERAKWNELLLSSVAHELRTPLTVILGYAQVLCRNPNLPDSLRRPVAVIETSALRMRASIDDLAHRWKRGGDNST